MEPKNEDRSDEIAAIESVVRETAALVTSAEAERQAIKSEIGPAEVALASSEKAYQKRPTRENRDLLDKNRAALDEKRDRHRKADAECVRVRAAKQKAERALKETRASAAFAELPRWLQARSLETFHAATAPHFAALRALLPQMRAACRAIDAAKASNAHARMQCLKLGEHDVPELDTVHLFGGLLRDHVEAHPASVVEIVSGIDAVRSGFANLPGDTLEAKLCGPFDFAAHTNRALSASASPETIAAYRADLETILNSATAHEATLKRREAKLAREGGTPPPAPTRAPVANTVGRFAGDPQRRRPSAGERR